MKCPNCGAEVSQINGEFFCLECGEKINISDDKNPKEKLNKNQDEQSPDSSSINNDQSNIKKNKVKKFVKKSSVDSIYPSPKGDTEKKQSSSNISQKTISKTTTSDSSTTSDLSKKEENKPRNLGQLLNDGMNIFIKNIKSFIFLVGAIQLPLLIILFISSFFLGISFYTQLVNSSISPENTQEQFRFIIEKLSNPLIIIVFAIIMLIFIFFSILLAISSVIAVIKAIKGEQIKILDCYKEGLKKFLSFTWINILVGLAVLGGFILLIIPGIIFAVWFTFAGYKLISDDIKGKRALSESKNLVSGYWWKVFGNLFVASLLVGMAGSLISLPFDIFSGLNIPFVSPFISIIPSLIQQILGIFTIIVGVLLFFDLKAVKESSQ